MQETGKNRFLKFFGGCMVVCNAVGNYCYYYYYRELYAYTHLHFA